MSVQVYISCRMTGRDKSEQVRRARQVCAVLKQYGIDPISPVFAEKIEDKPGPLINNSRSQLEKSWAWDKNILRFESQVMLWDGATDKSFGCEREMGLQRFCLWKPVVLLMPDVGLTVADLEDDHIAHDLHEAGRFIRDNYGTWEKRALWRLRMLARTLPGFIVGQLYAWR